MKVRIGNYPNRWNCNIHTNYMERKYGYYYDSWDESITWDEKLLEKIENGLQWLYNNTVNRYYDNAEQSVSVRIDPWDTWSMDYTLAHIVVPMLKQLKETKHGAPNVDMEDVPENIRPTEEDLENYAKNGTTDTKFFARWDWVLDEMIYAFESKLGDDVFMRFDPRTQLNEMNEEQDRISNGFRLFGKYYESLWD
jgi:hypothetical protein